MSAALEERLPCVTSDPEQVKRDLDEFGYGILGNLLNDREVDALKTRLVEQAEAECEAGKAWLSQGDDFGWIGAPRQGEIPGRQIVKTLLNKGKVFEQLAMNPMILAMMKHIFRGDNFYLNSSNGLILRKGANAQAIHVDQLLPEPTLRPYVANVLVMLTDFRVENGATRVVPKSHLKPPPPTALDSRGQRFNPVEIETVPAVGPIGAAVFFEGRLWHGAGSSSAEEPRYAISAYFSHPIIRQQDNYPASLHENVYQRMSDATRAMIGFKTGPFGRVDPTTPTGRSNTDIKWPYIPEMKPSRQKPIG